VADPLFPESGFSATVTGNKTVKMRIALFNWAPIYGDFAEGGGVSIYLKNIAYALMEQGHDVTVLTSGFFYDLARRDVYLRCNPQEYTNIKFIDIMNSRVIAPAFVMFHNVERVLSDDETKNALRMFLTDYGPFDVFHIQNIEGIPYSSLELKNEFPATKFILSNHNYHSICPQVNLWYNEETLCDNYFSGIACYSCVNRYTQFAHFFALRAVTTKLNRKVKATDNQHVTATIAGFNLDDLSWFEDYGLDDKSFDRRSLLIHGKNKFEYRRVRAVEYMNKHLDAISAVSREVAGILIQSGVNRHLISVDYIGTNQYNGLSNNKKEKINDKIHICFLGYTRKDKGFYYLLEQLSDMPAELNGKISFTFAGKIENSAALVQLRKLGDKLDRLTVIDGYKHSDLPAILSSVDIGIVPPLWQDALPQVAIEFLCNRVPVLVSCHGGQKEIIGDESFVFHPEKEGDFWTKLTRIIHDPTAIDKFWQHGVRLLTVREHMHTLVTLYKSDKVTPINNV